MKQVNIYPTSSIKVALEKLEKNQVGTLIVINKNRKFLGTLTNGDLRRAILKTKSISQKISNHYNKRAIFFIKGETPLKKIEKILIKEKFDYIPILNKSMKVIKLFGNKDCNKKIQNKKNNNEIDKIKVVIMAGGLGTRLEPFTSILPKPLIPINGKPVIKHIIESLKLGGIKIFWITLNYKSILLKSYFREIKSKEKINFIEEKKPLGTVGSVRLIEKKLSTNFFLTNCDTIIKTNYLDIYNFHKKNSFDLTIVASLKKYVIPYGVCEANKDYSLKELNEKPFYDLLVNTGLYLIKKDIIKMIPLNKKYDMNMFISDLKKKNKKIGIYPIDSDSWVDVGQWSEYKNALELLNY
ncbi:sugar phosphate nucleotidyltransferase [Pelagibacterales bacterium]|nr:sugar phosphate nucleotidyltransferase [Pelagibacterales bacterium]